MPELTGRTLGKYRIQESLGQGGMAEVYKGYHPALDRYVAIKVMHTHLVTDQDFILRFQREARAVAALSHPNIVQVFDFDIEGTMAYMVMQLVDGANLKTYLENLSQRRERMAIPTALNLFVPIASALDYAHQSGMLHRDIKPSNIMVDRAGKPFLGDFGVARIMSDTRLTATGAVIGTPAYMSPEQGQGRPLTSASDLYSLGVVLYEMLTGQAPFESDTPLGIIHKHIYEPLPAPHLLRPDIPEALERILIKALAKDIYARYQTIDELLQALFASGLASVQGKAAAIPTVLYPASPPTYPNTPPGGTLAYSSSGLQAGIPADTPPPVKPATTPQEPQTPPPTVVARVTPVDTPRIRQVNFGDSSDSSANEPPQGPVLRWKNFSEAQGGPEPQVNLSDPVPSPQPNPDDAHAVDANAHSRPAGRPGWVVPVLVVVGIILIIIILSSLSGGH